MTERKLKKFLYLISIRDLDGIREFYNDLYNEDLELQEKNEYNHQFLMQFLNMEEYSDSSNQKEEPNSDRNYVCIRIKFNEDFYIDNFYTKRELKLHPYWYNNFLYYNNLVGAETYLHICEFNDSNFEAIKQCNNLVVTLEQKEELPFYSEKWAEEYKDIFEKYQIFPRNVLSNSKELILVFDLMRSINLKIDSVRHFYETIERKLNQEFHSEKKEFILLPGSICKDTKHLLNKKQKIDEFQCHELVNDQVCYLEIGFKKCFYQGIPFYNGNSVNLSSLGNLFYADKREEVLFSEHKKRYTKVGLQRVQDLDNLLKLRNYDLKEKKQEYFSIYANVLFYLGKDIITVLNELQEINGKLQYPLKEKYLYNSIQFQFEKYLEYLEDVKKGIKYTNEMIVEKLSISFDEQDSMLQLMTKETAKLRKNYRDREYSRKHYQKVEKVKQENFEDDVFQVLSMLELGCTKTEISKRLRISRNKITRIIQNNL